MRSVSNYPSPFSPPSLPNLGIEIEWGALGSIAQLNPWAVYVAANRLMYQLSIRAWSEPLDRAYFEEGLGHRAWIAVRHIPPHQQLTVEHTARALYKVIYDMAILEPGFVAANVTISVSDLAVGNIMIGHGGVPPQLSTRSSLRETLTASNLFSPDGNYTIPLNGSLTTGSGEIIDPDNTRFRISYTYDGSNIPIQDICFALFDGLAQSAQFPQTQPLSHITAVSASSNFVIHIGVGGESGITLRRWYFWRAYLLLFTRFVLPRKEKLQEMSFGVSWNGKVYATGYMLKLKSAGLATIE